MALNFLLKRSGTASKRPTAASMALGEIDINYNSSTGGLFYKDSAGSVVKVGPAEVGSTAPNSSPAGSAGNSVGEFWYDTANSVLNIWNGTSWVNTVSTLGFLSTSGGSMTGNLYISNCELQVESNSTFVSAGTATFTGTTELNGATSFFFTPTWFENIGAASQVTYDNTVSGLAATEVQAAVDELASGSWLPAATTTTPGIVQLNDTTSSTSTTEALTANQGKELQDQINALSIASNITFAGTIDATTGNLVTVTAEGTTAGFIIGDPLPAAASGNDNYFVIVTTPGTMTPPGGSAQECHQGDWWLSDGTAWVFLDVGFNATAATTSTPGVVQLATDAEVQAGLNTDHAVTPSGLQSKVSDSTSTTSSSTLASSTAVKAAYDAGIQGQTDAAAALTAANAAGAEVGNLSSLTTTDKTSAVAAINEVNTAASAAQGDATQAISDASAAQTTADQAVLDAAAAQTDATQALSDAASAQATADAAVPDASYTALGDILSGTGAGTYAALALGTADQVLTVDTTCPGGLKWAAGASQATPAVAGLLPGCDNSTNGITAVGSNALLSLTTGTENIAIGLNAGCSLTTGSSNIAIGASALCSVIDTTENTAVGDLALWKTTGDSNTAVGSRAGKCVTVGYGNTAVGRSALEFTCGGDYNSGVGVSALRNACGNYNAALGYQAGYRSDGDNNVFVGADSGAQLLTGAWNIFLGYNSGFSVVSGCNNVLIGADVDPGADVSNCLMIGTSGPVPFTWLTGDSTSAIKPSAGIIDCAGSCGTAGQVLMSNGANAVCWGTAGGGGSSPATPTVAGTVLGCTADSISALGCNALLNNTTGVNNTATGCGALTTNTTGNRNTATGAGALAANTTGENNTAVGFGALSASTTARQNTGIGCGALRDNTTGSCNTAVGQAALVLNTTGFNNTSVGVSSLVSNTTGDNNTAVGRGSLLANTTGIGNTSVGSFALSANTTGGRNTAVGRNALLRINTGCSNIAVGACSGCSYTTESNNSILGNYAGGVGDANTVTLSDGLGDIKAKFDALGALSFDGTSFGAAGEVLQSNGPGAKPTWVAAGGGGSSPATPTVAGIVLGLTDATTANAALGLNALLSSGAGSGANVAVGTDALTCFTTGFGNVAVGYGSLAVSVDGQTNVSIGTGAMSQTTSGSGNVGVGTMALSAICTSSNNVSVGNCSMFGAGAGDGNVALGAQSLCLTSGSNNVAVGIDAACLSLSGNQNVAIGPGVQVSDCAGSCQLSIGFSATDNWITGTSTKAIKPGAGIIDCNGSCGALGQYLMSTGANSVRWFPAPTTPSASGTTAGILFGYSCGGNNNVSLGFATTGQGGGDGNTAIGSNALASRGLGCENTALGALTLLSLTSGAFNTGLGRGALVNVTTSGCNTAVGYFAGRCVTGSGNTLIGCSAGCNITTGSCNLLIGSGVLAPSITGSCQLAIGWSTGCWITGDSTRAIKPNAGIIDCANATGTNGQVLASNGANAVCWAPAPISACLLTAKGSIVTATADSTPSALAVGSNGQFLTANSTTATGLAWAAGPAAATPNAAGLMYGYTPASVLDTNISVGQYALANRNGVGNTVVGFNSMGTSSATACWNVALGYEAAANIFSGQFNVGLGRLALGSVTTGSNNIAIGCASGVTTGGYTGIVNLTTESNRIIMGNFNHTCAQIKVAWTVTSDERDKAIDPNGVPYGLAFVNQIEPIAYCWCDRATGEITEDRKRFGFSAQNISALETATGESVIISTDDPDHLMLTDHMLLPVLVNAIKELSAKNDELEARIRSLEIPG